MARSGASGRAGRQKSLMQGAKIWICKPRLVWQRFVNKPWVAGVDENFNTADSGLRQQQTNRN
jgi:hypothetical protein